MKKYRAFYFNFKAHNPLHQNSYTTLEPWQKIQNNLLKERCKSFIFSFYFTITVTPILGWILVFNFNFLYYLYFKFYILLKNFHSCKIDSLCKSDFLFKNVFVQNWSVLTWATSKKEWKFQDCHIYKHLNLCI